MKKAKITCSHPSSDGAEGPASKLGRTVVIWKCQVCGEKFSPVLEPLKRACEAQIAMHDAVAEIEEIIAGEREHEAVRCMVEDTTFEWVSDFAMDFEAAEGLSVADVKEMMERIDERLPTAKQRIAG